MPSLSISGEHSFSIEKGKVKFNLEKIINHHNGNSGSIRVYLITIDYWYEDGAIPADRHKDVAWFQLDPLEKGYSYVNISRYEKELTQARMQYFAFVLMQYEENSWKIQKVSMFGQQKSNAQIFRQNLSSQIDILCNQLQRTTLNKIDQERCRMRQNV